VLHSFASARRARILTVNTLSAQTTSLPPAVFELLQLREFGLGFFQDGDVGVGVFP
jgi:hypothetical protein